MKNEAMVDIAGREYWYKVVGMLQQNWALIDASGQGSCTVYFLDDLSGVFDSIELESVEVAELALVRNGFDKFASSVSAQGFLTPPEAPFFRRPHPNGPIYSSGRFWV